MHAEPATDEQIAFWIALELYVYYEKFFSKFFSLNAIGPYS